MKTAVQFDFDGTITEEDVSFVLLDEFAEGDWRRLLKEYMEGRISVGAFNTMAFAMIKADERTLVDFVLNNDAIKVRAGFRELLDFCTRKGLKFVIVSNGVDFYIDAILKDMGLPNVEFYAARSRFLPEGMDVKYIGPDGQQIEVGFKEAYTRALMDDGYSIIYAGNGVSDIYPARLAGQVFATGDLLERCREENLECITFNDLQDVVRGLEGLSLT